MEMTSLEAMTRIDRTLPRGRVHIANGVASFPSEYERRTWLANLMEHYIKLAEDKLIEELIGPRYEPQEDRNVYSSFS